MVFYLKYRPQTLEDLTGQENVKKTLSEAFKTGKLSHAYLFVGPRGTGKTSTARILAKMVNCEKLEDAKKDQDDKSSIPCNQCKTCITITDGSNLDLIEIDAASNRGIDDIRNLRENIKLSPTSSRKKVYIIDEVHMLTTEAFNALLKTLEEPPSHVLFILATTEVQKIPQTILSRVQRMDFKLASVEDLLTRLKKVVSIEKIEIEEEALRLLAKKADGSFRDGDKLLDQLSSLEKKITVSDVTEGLKFAKWNDVIEIIESLIKKDAKEAILKVTAQLSYGISVKDMILSLMENFRYFLLIKNGLGEKLVKEEVGSNRYQSLLKAAANLEIDEVIFSLEVFQQALEKIKVTLIPSLPLEVAMVEISGEKLKVKSEKIKVIEPEVIPTPGVELEKVEKHIKTIVSPIPTPGVGQSKGKIPASDQSPDVIRLTEKWNFVLETVRPYNYSLEALLRSVAIRSCEEGIVVIEVPYSFHQRILETPKSRDLLESILSDILSKPIKISTVLGARPVRVEDIANVEIAADDEIISLASEIFNGKLVD